MSSGHRSFPKEKQKKLNQTIRDLKAQLRKKDKEISFLRYELENVVKPIRERKPHIELTKEGYDAWRKDFVRRYKRDVLGENS